MGCPTPNAVVHRHHLLPISPHPPLPHYRINKLILAKPHHPFLLSKFPTLKINPRRNRATSPVVVAAQSNFIRVVQTVIRVGKDGIETGMNLVPDSIPRPIARVSLTAAAVAVVLFIIKSFLSTVFFALGVMGFVYFIYLALNKDKGSRVDKGPASTDEAVEEAKRIMEKYK